ncbi:SRPBCC family protein [Streptomyces sp. K1PA1]|uniref:SRPBCC family protein n=1 Tax=Streptomyces tropicalis TaxID=3034234 RepID=A0ABT6A362_9ACTN|nr:SRPBCC family protein [Streptomyces tropicalis]
MGTSTSHPLRGRWPQVGSALRYEVRLGPWRFDNETVVRRCEVGRVLELEAKAGPLGTARIAVELRDWGEHCLVIVDEHPLRGAGGVLHNAAVESLIQLRHRAMLARLAGLCERDARPGRPRAVGPGRSAGVRGGGGRARRGGCA